MYTEWLFIALLIAIPSAALIFFITSIIKYKKTKLRFPTGNKSAVSSARIRLIVSIVLLAAVIAAYTVQIILFSQYMAHM